MRAVLEQFARENAALKEQLLSLANGAKPTGHGRSGRNSTTAEPAALVLIATLLVLCCFLPADKAMMVGSAVPVLIAMQLLLQQQVKDGSAAFDALIRTLAQLKGLLAKSSRGLKRYMNCVLYKRHYFCGRKLMRELVKIHSSDTTSDAAAAEADAKAAAQKQQHASSPSSAVPASSRDLACAMDIDPKLSPGLVDGSRSTTPTPIMPASSCFDALDFLSPFAGVVIKPEVLC